MTALALPIEDLERQVADRTLDTQRAGRYAATAVAMSFLGNAAHFLAELLKDGEALDDAKIVQLAAEHTAGPVVVLVATHLLLHAAQRTVEYWALWVGVLAGFALSAIHLHGLASPQLGPELAVLLPVAVEAASVGSILQYARNRDDQERLTQDLADRAERANIATGSGTDLTPTDTPAVDVGPTLSLPAGADAVAAPDQGVSAPNLAQPSQGSPADVETPAPLAGVAAVDAEDWHEQALALYLGPGRPSYKKIADDITADPRFGTVSKSAVGRLLKDVDRDAAPASIRVVS